MRQTETKEGSEARKASKKFYLDDIVGGSCERRRWYTESYKDDAEFVLPPGKYILGVPELFFDTVWLKHAKSLLPKKPYNVCLYDEANTLAVFRMKPGTDLALYAMSQDKVVFTKAPSGLIVLSSVDNIMQGRYRDVVRFEIQPDVEAKVIAKVKDTEFRYIVFCKGDPIGSVYFENI